MGNLKVWKGSQSMLWVPHSNTWSVECGVLSIRHKSGAWSSSASIIFVPTVSKLFVRRPWLIMSINLRYSFNVHAWLPFRMAMSWNGEEPRRSFQMLEGRSPIGYYVALFNVLTSMFTCHSTITHGLRAKVQWLWVWQSCHSHKISKFPDFSLTYFHFSLTIQIYEKKDMYVLEWLYTLLIIMYMSVYVSNSKSLRKIAN